MTRTFPVVIILIALLLGASPGAAQEVPRFYIEKIDVRDYDRVSPEVVVYESRLREGAEYSENDLRDAAARLTRLPFLLGAEFSLEKGSERGRYNLVITINETRGFFYRLDLVQVLSDTEGVDTGPSTRLGSDDSGAALGWRWFLGRRGALHLAFIGRDETEFTRGYAAFAVGYTLYDIFGTKAFATVNLKHSPEQSGITPQIVVGMPLSLNQTLTAEFDSMRVDNEFLIFDLVDGPTDKQKFARVTWSYNTTNHPFVPTDGTLISAGPLAVWREQRFGATIVEEGGIDFTTIPLETTTYGLQASALRYWEVSDRNSLSLGVEAGVARKRESDPYVTRDYNSAYGVVQGGLSVSLWPQEWRAQGGDSRLELVVRGRIREDKTQQLDYVLVDEKDNAQATFSWVRHSSWGTLRVGVGYAW